MWGIDKTICSPRHGVQKMNTCHQGDKLDDMQHWKWHQGDELYDMQPWKQHQGHELYNTLPWEQHQGMNYTICSPGSDIRGH